LAFFCAGSAIAEMVAQERGTVRRPGCLLGKSLKPQMATGGVLSLSTTPIPAPHNLHTRINTGMALIKSSDKILRIRNLSRDACIQKLCISELCYNAQFPVPGTALERKRTMAIRPNHEQISRRAKMSSCNSVSDVTSRRKCCTLAARLPRCCSKNFKVKTGSGAERDPKADPPIEDEAPEPANEAELALTDGLSNPEAELAEPAPPNAKPVKAATAELASELAEPAEAATAMRASDADPPPRSVASINIQDRESKLIAKEMLKCIINGPGQCHQVVCPRSQTSE
jgi:hypothetical protein